MFEADEQTEIKPAADPYADQVGKVGKVTTNDSPIDRLPVAPAPVPEPASKSAMKSEKVQRLWSNLMGQFLHEMEVQGPNRAEMAEDEAYYDGDQWSPEDIQVLKERNQLPIVYNVISTALNWIAGTERRTRTDYKVLPRREEGAKPAARKSELMKYLSDVNRSEFAVSRAFQDASRVGIGWLEGGLQDADEGEPIYARYESWRNMLHDSTAIEQDLSDGRYQFRHKWTDADVAQAFFPGAERAAIIDRAAASHVDGGVALDLFGDDAMDQQEDHAINASSFETDHAAPERRRLRLIEGWFVKPTVAPKVVGGQFSGELFDPASPGHRDEVMTGQATIKHKTVMRMHVMIFTIAGPLFLAESPYRHNKYPFTPIFGFRKGGTNLPYGIIRNLKGMQNDINKRASKALAIMSSNRTTMDEGAVRDLDEFEEEVARPNAIIVKRKGYDLTIDSDRGMDVAHLDMMSRTIALVQTSSGITDENLGRETNASSGKAINARQEQGSLATSMLFDNLRYARQVHGEKELSLIEQFMTEERKFRITNQRGNPSWPAINDGLPENDIIRTKADYIISEDSWDATLRQAKSDQMIEMVSKLGPVAPQVIMVVLDLLIEGMDMPNGEEMVKRVRQMTGMMDPDADLQNPDPETAQMMEAQAAKAEKQDRIENAEIETKEAEAAEKKSRAEKARVEAERIIAELPGSNLKAKSDALALAIEMLNARPAIPVADTLLAEAGIVMPPAPPQPMPPAPQPAAPQPQFQ